MRYVVYLLRYSCLCLLFSLDLICGLTASTRTGRAEDFVAADHARQTIYHSPQSPGYTCWCGAWTMPDGRMMVTFTEATGPIDGRPSGPADILQRLSWPPPGLPAYDMTGLDLRNVHLESADGGAMWKKVSADLFHTCMNGSTGPAELALSNDVVLRGVEGFQLPYEPKVPQAGYIQRSLDGTKSWSKPQVLLDPSKMTVYPKRLRKLRDGRLMIVGGIAYIPSASRTRSEYGLLYEPLLIVSSDEGMTWSDPIPVVSKEQRHEWGGEECDAAELPNGDLLFVFRRVAPDQRDHEERWQALLKKDGQSWKATTAVRAPFPHSGHPELLATKEGPILHVATSGIHWTNDAGTSWNRLDIPGTAYYPRTVQTSDGRIFIFAHVGSDDPYGKVDQSIVMDAFRLRRKG